MVRRPRVFFGSGGWRTSGTNTVVKEALRQNCIIANEDKLKNTTTPIKLFRLISTIVRSTEQGCSLVENDFYRNIFQQAAHASAVAKVFQKDIDINLINNIRNDSSSDKDAAGGLELES